MSKKSTSNGPDRPVKSPTMTSLSSCLLSSENRETRSKHSFVMATPDDLSEHGSQSGSVKHTVGLAVGALVGLAVGGRVGRAVGDFVGLAVGDRVGLAVGDDVGLAVGCRVGRAVGDLVGVAVGAVGDLVGNAVGAAVGDVGDCVGDVVGDTVGDDVGAQKTGGHSVSSLPSEVVHALTSK